MADIQKELQEAQELVSTGDFPAAVKKFTKILKADPDCAEAHFGKAEAAIGDPGISEEDIVASYRRALDIEPKNPIYWSSFAAYLIEQGKFNEAEAAYNRAAEIDPDNGRYYLSEFGVEYATRAPVVMERFLDEKTKDMIHKKALQYLLRSIGLTESEAKRLL